MQALVGVDAREATSPLMTEVADRPAASPEPAMLFFVPGAAPGAATARAYGLQLITRDQRLQDSPLLRTVW